MTDEKEASNGDLTAATSITTEEVDREHILEDNQCLFFNSLKYVKQKLTKLHGKTDNHYYIYFLCIK